MNTRPVGDPAAVEAAARAILSIVATLQGVDTSIERALPARAYEARGRTKLNGSLRSSATRVTHTATSLERLANTLGRAADDLRVAQKRWDSDERARVKREAERCTPTPRPR